MILEKLKPSTKKYVQDQICALLNVDAKISEQVVNEFSHQRTQCSGSMVEGAIMARCFQRNEDWNEIEADVMCNSFTIPQEISYLLEPVENKLGFVRLLFCCGHYISAFFIFRLYGQTRIYHFL